MNKVPCACVVFTGIVWSISTILLVVFIILQVVINPRNHPIRFSTVFGSDRRINFPGDPCNGIEIANFDPTHNITVVLTTASSIDVDKRVEQILVNHTLAVGENSDQLSYYGVPVLAEGDEVSLYVRALDQATQSVSISVYDLNGFTRLNANSVATSKYNYNFDSCLNSTLGCIANPIVQSEGWLYFVFESQPTPSNLLVSLDATIREYDIDVSIIRGGCTLDETNDYCYIDTPKEYRSSRRSNSETTSINYLPFSLTFESNNILPYQAPSTQSLNISTDLVWTCLRSDLWNYVIVATVFGVVFLIATIIILLAFFRCVQKSSIKLPSLPHNIRRHQEYRTASTNLNSIQMQAVIEEKRESTEHARTESLPPAYDNLESQDEKPYFNV